MKKWPADRVERRDIESLIPYARNARTHSDEQVAQIAASMKEWGWTNPVLVDETGMIISGHGRVMAAQKLGLPEVPVMVAEGWTEAQKKAYVLADNQLALNAEWDMDLLAGELAELHADDFDLNLLGFDDKFVDDLLITEEDSGAAEMPTLSSGEKTPFQNKTFVLHDEQAALVDDAITLARTMPNVDTGLNENSNGNALALICEEWLRFKNGDS
jgi:ParB family chromosome partitioning protein